MTDGAVLKIAQKIHSQFYALHILQPNLAEKIRLKRKEEQVKRVGKTFANTHCNDLLVTYLSLTDKEMNLSSMEGKSWQELVQDLLGYDPFRCNKCKKGMMLLDSRINAKPRAA